MNPPVSLFPFGEYWPFYLGFLLLVFVLLAVDLGVFHRKAHAVSIREAASWSVVWVSLALLFNLGFFRLHAVALPARRPAHGRGRVRPVARRPRDRPRVPGRVRRRVLALGRQHLRVRRGADATSGSRPRTSTGCSSSASSAPWSSAAIFIALGAALLQFEWVIWLFGLFLVFTGVQDDVGRRRARSSLRTLDHPAVPEAFRPVTADYHGDELLRPRTRAVLHATPLFVASLFLEMTDIVFAVDSVPAIFGLTREPLSCSPRTSSPSSACAQPVLPARGGGRQVPLPEVRARASCSSSSGSRWPWLNRLSARPLPDHVVARHHRRRDRRLDRAVAALSEAGPGGLVTDMEPEGVSKEITPKGQDYSQWYLDVVLKADMADYGPVKGCMVIKPYGYAMWESMQRDMDRRIKETGHVNAYFPLFVPKSLPREGEGACRGLLARVRVGDDRRRGRARGAPRDPADLRGDHLLDVRQVGQVLARPAGADQPVGERGPLGEGDAAVPAHDRVPLAGGPHPPRDRRGGAGRDTQDARRLPRASPRRCWRCRCSWARRRTSEKFAGALRTYAIEALMGDGRALQAGTSHDLGQHFAKAYGIEFLDKNQERAKPWSTSWGDLDAHDRRDHHDPRRRLGTRSCRRRVATYQVVIVPIPPRKGDINEAVLPKAREVAAMLRGAGFRVHLDDRDQFQPGYKYADWEMRGVPVRLEIGPKDIEKDAVRPRAPRHSGRRSSCRSPGPPRAWARSTWRSRRTCSRRREASSPPTPPGSGPRTSSSR